MPKTTKYKNIYVPAVSWRHRPFMKNKWIFCVGHKRDKMENNDERLNIGLESNDLI